MYCAFPPLVSQTPSAKVLYYNKKKFKAFDLKTISWVVVGICRSFSRL